MKVLAESIYSIQQHEHDSVEDYFRRFEATQDLIVLSNGTVMET